MFFKILNSIENDTVTNNIITNENNIFYGLTENDLSDLKIICDLSDLIQIINCIVFHNIIFI